MFRNSFQKGCFTVFYSVGSDPASNWSIHSQNGYAKRIFDEDIRSMVMELSGTNVSVMYMTCPREPHLTLGIKLPFLVLLIKNLHKYFTFEVKIIDDTRFNRRFRVSNFQSRTSIKPFCTQMPLGLASGWNQIHFNLADFTRRAYGTNYMETVRLQIHANIRIRRIYFTDRLLTEEELPNEYRLIRKTKDQLKSKEFKTPAARPPSPAKSAEHSDAPQMTDTELLEPSVAAEPAPISEVQVEKAAPEPDHTEAAAVEAEQAPPDAAEVAEEAKPEAAATEDAAEPEPVAVAEPEVQAEAA